jgi:hypothetical protein
MIEGSFAIVLANQFPFWRWRDMRFGLPAPEHGFGMDRFPAFEGKHSEVFVFKTPHLLIGVGSPRRSAS